MLLKWCAHIFWHATYSEISVCLPIVNMNYDRPDIFPPKCQDPSHNITSLFSRSELPQWCQMSSTPCKLYNMPTSLIVERTLPVFTDPTKFLSLDRILTACVTGTVQCSCATRVNLSKSLKKTQDLSLWPYRFLNVLDFQTFKCSTIQPLRIRHQLEKYCKIRIIQSHYGV